ncbi:MAG: DUF3343 domain-containing protein [Peptostreptococcaceae bacterium]|nr:DUF3343 domain-containing protein [Peptostreptococcaceae bacterium]
MEKNRYLVLFFTQYGAIHYARLLKKENLHCETKPVPRSLSSSCGVCVETETEKNVLDFITEDVEFIYRIREDGSFELLYEQKEE